MLGGAGRMVQNCLVFCSHFISHIQGSEFSCGGGLSYLLQEENMVFLEFLVFSIQ